MTPPTLVPKPHSFHLEGLAVVLAVVKHVVLPLPTWRGWKCREKYNNLHFTSFLHCRIFYEVLCQQAGTFYMSKKEKGEVQNTARLTLTTLGTTICEKL